MARITVIDAICGAGKTSWMIDKMRSDNRRWLYVCPYLSECERVIKACSERRFKQPKERTEGKLTYTKADNLYELLEQGENIVTTHALFRDLTSDAGAEIRKKSYTLCLDEVMDIVQPLRFDHTQIQALFERGFLKTEEIDDNDSLLDKEKVMRVIAGDEDRLDKLYLKGSDAFDNGVSLADLRAYADRGRLVWVHQSMLIWLFPSTLFDKFREVYNLTYLFDGSYQKYFYDLHGMDFDYKTVIDVGNRDYRLIKYKPNMNGDRKDEIKKLITIYEGERNDSGEGRATLSKNWWTLKAQKRKREINMGNHVRNYFKNDLKASATDVIWTCFKVNQKSKRAKGIQPRGYVSSHVPHNQRATNLYRKRYGIAFLCNIWLNPIITEYFKAFGYPINEDLFSLSTLVQFIFRSSLRDGKPVSIFVPSARMRRLLSAWLNDSLEAKGDVIPLN